MKTRSTRRKPLSRERVLAAALALVDAEGLAGLSMRRLAAVLHVEAMSLYHHVRDKGDLLSGLVDVVLSRIAPPDPSRPWSERVEAVALGLYRALVAHPSLVLIIASEEGAPTSGEVLRGMDGVVAALAESGLSPAQQVSAFRGLLAMCFGFVLTHTQGLRATRAQAEAAWQAWDSAKWDPAALPHLARLAPQFLITRPDDDFRFMLTAYLDALRATARGPAA